MTTELPNVPVWDDEAWTPLPALRGDAEADVCVIGLGGSGLTCVGELRRRGLRVVGLDAGPVGGGAAGRNGGFLLAGLAPFHHDAAAVLGRERARTLYRLTIAEIERIAAETPEAVRRVGSLRIAASPEEAEDCRRQRQAMEADGLPVEPYDGPEGHGLLLPTDGAFQPLRRCRLLARRAIDAGARLHERSRAVELRPDEVRTAEGRVRCAATVVAVDGALDRLLPELSDRVRTARLQMLATAPTQEVRFPRPVYTRWGYDYWQQLGDGRLVIGGFRDREERAEWTHASDPSAAIQGHLERFVRERLGVTAPVTHRWAASVSYTDGPLPVLAEVRPRTWALGGYSGTGNVVGALCGRAVAELVADGRSEIGAAFGAVARGAVTRES